MSKDTHALGTMRTCMEMSAAIVAASGMAVTPHVERLLEPLISGEMTPQQHETWLLQQLQEARNAG